tara:strand:- start:404 stop:829 length:426 start_codon:yes stop_codon:yes gene_type:complete
MKKSIKIFAAVGIVFLLTFSTNAQEYSYDWTGKWETTLLGNHWDVNITKKSDGSYTGTFPNGTLVGKYQFGDLIGSYTRTNVKMDKTGIKMGKTGKFRFVMHADEKEFTGNYKPEGKNDWQPENWNGKRPPNRKHLSKRKD